MLNAPIARRTPEQFISLLLLLLLCVFAGCSKKEGEVAVKLPEVTTASATAVTSTTLTIGGNVTSDGGGTITERGVVSSKTAMPTVNDGRILSGKGTGSYTIELTNLYAKTTYYIRAYATNSEGTAYGNQVVVTTGSIALAQVSTVATTPITLAGATVTGNVTADGGYQVTERGICYAKQSGPTTSNEKVISGKGTGTFIATLTDLEPNTRYFVRAFAVNAGGVAYGAEMILEPFSVPLPKITTTAVISVTHNAAVAGGDVTDDSGLPVTERGLCYALLPNPGIEGSKVVSGQGKGKFSAELKNLIENKEYNVRAYAVNSAGVAYGENIKFRTVVGPPDFSKVDGAVTSVMKQYNIPGASIAIVMDEKLMYVQSYGFADKENNQLASNHNLYRLASISKPITLAAILMLVADGKLTLDQQVFGPGGILGNDFGVPPAHSDKERITVRHLLDHKSGFTNNINDAVFSYPNYSQAQLISYLLANRALDYVPGTTGSYNNFGYVVLGRVIEKASGKSYERYVKEHVLAPCGISEMRIGGSRLADRYPAEVKYYPNAPLAYNMMIERLDAAGGWVASATDLARLIVRIDRGGVKTDILPANLLNQFYTGFNSWTHDGSLPGTSTRMAKVDNKFSVIILTNSRIEGQSNQTSDFYDAVVSQIRAMNRWPTDDQF